MWPMAWSHLCKVARWSWAVTAGHGGVSQIPGQLSLSLITRAVVISSGGDCALATAG